MPLLQYAGCRECLSYPSFIMPFLSFLPRENLVVKSAAQAIVLIAVVQTLVQRGSPPGFVLLFAASLFSILLWLLPTDNPWRANRYMLIQVTIASLALFQEFIFVYLFFVLSAQAMLLYSARSGLVWNGVLLTLALLANFLFHFEGELAPGPRGLMVAVGFILACILSAGIATVRRDREKIHHLMSQLAEANTLLQESRKQAEKLAAEQERNRITRELNYSLGHKMTVAIVQLEGAVLLLDKDPGRVAASLNTVHDQLKKGLNDLRRIAKQV